MLLPYCPPEISAEDRQLFDRLVLFDHWTRRADALIDFQALRETIVPLFSDEGRPAIEPVLFIKIELIMFHDNLSDSQVMARAQSDLAYRRFLGLGRDDDLPNASTLAKFRARLGPQGHLDLFHALLGQARGHGLVKDRLRLKDATHVLADIAIPAALQLIAQARNKLLSAAGPFDGERVKGEQVRVTALRESTVGCSDEMRLEARVHHLADILAWVDQLEPPEDADENPTWQALSAAADIARKALGGHADPNAPGKMRSTADPDARRGRHGSYYDGYMVDVLVDADSELFTAINTLPADGNESLDTLTLVKQEQAAHHNAIGAVSIDGAGYDGPVIDALESAGVAVFVPPKEMNNGGKFTVEQFQFSPDGSYATCPAGHRSQYKQRDEKRHVTAHRFDAKICHACPLKEQCIDPQQKHGRTVRNNDYNGVYERVRQRAQTDEYAAIRREHPKVERRLGELVNRHGARRARYRGTQRVLIQQMLGAITANLKRMIRLLDAPIGFASC
jgi:transposase